MSRAAEHHHRHLSHIILGAANEHRRRAEDAEQAARQIRAFLRDGYDRPDLRRAMDDALRLARVHRQMHEALLSVKRQHDESRAWVPTMDNRIRPTPGTSS